MNLILRDKYETIPGALYDDVELSIVVVCDDFRGGVYVESLGDDSKASETAAQEAVASGEALEWKFAVYWHCSSGGVEHVADFDHRESAERLFAALKSVVNLKRGSYLIAAQYAEAAIFPATGAEPRPAMNESPNT